MAENTLKHLYLEELRNLYDAENQLIKALPKMAKKAESEELRSGIEKHLEQTRAGPSNRTDLRIQGRSGKAKNCKGMQGIISEGSRARKEGLGGAVLSARRSSGIF